ncbi:MAG: cellulase family glycosylhydrolase [Bacteroidales bacterium]|nr:MAG: cellulase family glycosylhydrolase [Bacteroidales bacterium]
MRKKIFAILHLIIILATIFSCIGKSDKGKTAKKDSAGSDKMQYIENPSGFVIRKGVNLSHWMSQTRDWSPKDKFITREDIKLIHSFGFDHVRIPIDEEELWYENGEVIKQSLEYVKSCLSWCSEFGLRAVIDLHILRSHHFNARNNEGKMTLWSDTVAQNNLMKLWENLSEYLRDYPNNMVAYEIMNEPVAPDHEQWNKLIDRAVKIIRQREPGRIIIIGSNMWQQPYTFPFLKVPENDRNIILSVHTYHPYFLTHYKAYWSAAKNYHGPVQYPGQCISDSAFEKYVDKTDEALMSRLDEEKARNVYNKDTLHSILQDAIDKSRELGLQLYCNEFGCLPSIPEETRLKYYEDITDIFRENCIAFANWDYKGDFRIVEWDRKNLENKEPNIKLIKILTR